MKKSKRKSSKARKASQPKRTQPATRIFWPEALVHDKNGKPITEGCFIYDACNGHSGVCTGIVNGFVVYEYSDKEGAIHSASQAADACVRGGDDNDFAVRSGLVKAARRIYRPEFASWTFGDDALPVVIQEWDENVRKLGRIVAEIRPNADLDDDGSIGEFFAAAPDMFRLLIECAPAIESLAEDDEAWLDLSTRVLKLLMGLARRRPYTFNAYPSEHDEQLYASRMVSAGFAVDPKWRERVEELRMARARIERENTKKGKKAA